MLTRITPRYFTVMDKFIFSPLILKFKCLVIILCFCLKITIFVLLVFKFILFALCQVLSHDLLRNLFSLSIYLSIVGWYHLQNDVLYLMLLILKSLINIINSRGPSTDPCGTPWIISWEFKSFPVTLVYCFLSVRNEWRQ